MKSARRLMISRSLALSSLRARPRRRAGGGVRRACVSERSLGMPALLAVLFLRHTLKAHTHMSEVGIGRHDLCDAQLGHDDHGGQIGERDIRFVTKLEAKHLRRLKTSGSNAF